MTPVALFQLPHSALVHSQKKIQNFCLIFPDCRNWVKILRISWCLASIQSIPRLPPIVCGLFLDKRETISLGQTGEKVSAIVPFNRGRLIGYVKSKPLGNGQIISLDVLVFVMIIAVFHKKLI